MSTRQTLGDTPKGFMCVSSRSRCACPAQACCHLNQPSCCPPPQHTVCPHPSPTHNQPTTNRPVQAGGWIRLWRRPVQELPRQPTARRRNKPPERWQHRQQELRHRWVAGTTTFGRARNSAQSLCDDGCCPRRQRPCATSELSEVFVHTSQDVLLKRSNVCVVFRRCRFRPAQLRTRHTGCVCAQPERGAQRLRECRF